jgi:hypothetical protein
MLLSLLQPFAARAQEATFPVPGHELWGTWRVDAIQVPKLPADVPIQSLSGWQELLDDPGVLPVNQTLEFRDRGTDDPPLMTLLEPIQPDVCLNDAWMSHCDHRPDDSYVAPKRPIKRTMLVEPLFVPRYRELSGFWPKLAPDGYDAIFEDSAPRSIYVYLLLRDPDTLYFPFVVFDKVLAKDKGMDGMVILKRVGNPSAKSGGK